MIDLAARPVVLVGAGRSGTNMLRDVLTDLEGFETWPCDEINPIWRHGNVQWPNDAIPPEKADRSRRYIRRAFDRIWRETGRPKFIVEKTCANSLRLPFVDAILPEARYIHIVRDGVDVVASAQKRWRGEMELATLPYYWAKLRYAPLADLPIYGWSFVKNRVAMATNSEKRMEIWGPRFPGMDAMREQGASLDEICAQQWVACVEAADAALAAMPKDKSLTLQYEAFTTDAPTAVANILDFLGEQRSTDEIAHGIRNVSKRSVGKGRKALSGNVQKLMEIMRPALAQFGYED